MNVRLLRRIQKQILKEPKQFEMHQWFVFQGVNVPNCGTTACIGGYAIALSTKQTPLEAARHISTKQFGKTKCDLSDRSKQKVETTARNLLGLTEEQGDRLFLEPDWPYKYRYNSRGEAIVTPKAKARNAVRRIDLFISTNGEE